MQVIRNERIICFDIDETLVLWGEALVNTGEREALTTNEPRGARRYIDVVDPYDGKTVTLRVHVPHVKLLANHLMRGTQVIVWSQGGYQWAEAVLNALGFGEDKILVMSKPFEYVDDLPVTEWLNNRLYISPDSSWGQGINAQSSNE